MSTVAQPTQNSTQYAMKKRKRPQPRPKASESSAVVKSNPSKRHRDRLNTELERLSQLIPLPPDVVNKLDKLSILRLSVAYLRNKSYTKYVIPEAKTDPNDLNESELAMQALEGFIMVVTQDFNVFYITSNVQDCLGFPQSDVIYQSMLELIHAEDRKLFMQQMQLNHHNATVELPKEEGAPAEVPEYVKCGFTPEMFKKMSQDGLLHRSFICRLRCLHDTSSGFLALHFTGHLGLVPGQNRHSENGTPLPPEIGLFVLASPLQTPSILEIRTKNYIFRTKHKLDYTPLGVDQKGRIVLGYTEQELRQQSGYQFIHSADMMHCADAHTKLMRKGQSGMTVFRLLHRANRWQWVTASARLVFTKGQPDYIISTHRPITDQEGEEHLKKRSNAFRFDFTGHASLYASVNPIGSGPPPPQNNNKSYGGPPESKPQVHHNGPSQKRARVSDVAHALDPNTLFGAQSLQTMDNYKDGLPIIEEIKATLPGYHDLGVKSEQNNDVSPLDFNQYFNQGTDFLSDGLMKQSPHTTGSLSSLSNDHLDTGSSPGRDSDQADSGYSDIDHHNLSPFSPMDPIHEPPPLRHPPIPAVDQGIDYNGQFNDFQQVNGYGSQVPPNASFGNMSHLPDPSPSYTHGQPQNNFQPANQMAYGQNPANQQTPLMNGHQPTSCAQQMRQGSHAPAPQQGYNQNYQLQHQNQGYQPPMLPIPNGKNGYPNNNVPYMGGRTTAQSKENASVLNALEISSITTTKQFTSKDETPEELENILGACANFLEAEEKSGRETEITFQCQEHTLQFDLDKIAAEYQTVNPYGVIQNFVQNNPQQAMTLKKGMMPEVPMQNPGMNYPNGHQMNGMNGQPTGQYKSCHYANGNGLNHASKQMPPAMHPQQPMNSMGMENELRNENELNFSVEDLLNIPGI